MMSVKHEENNKKREEETPTQGSIPRAILRKTGRNWAKLGILLLSSAAGDGKSCLSGASRNCANRFFYPVAAKESSFSVAFSSFILLTQ